MKEGSKCQPPNTHTPSSPVCTFVCFCPAVDKQMGPVEREEGQMTYSVQKQVWNVLASVFGAEFQQVLELAVKWLWLHRCNRQNWMKKCPLSRAPWVGLVSPLGPSETLTINNHKSSSCLSKVLLRCFSGISACDHPEWLGMWLGSWMNFWSTSPALNACSPHIPGGHPRSWNFSIHPCFFCYWFPWGPPICFEFFGAYFRSSGMQLYATLDFI